MPRVNAQTWWAAKLAVGWAAVCAAAQTSSSPSAPVDVSRIPLSQIAGAMTTDVAPAAPLDATSPAYALYQEAQSLLDDNEPARAADRLDKALRAAKDDYYELHYLLAVAKMRLGRLGEARLAAEAAARLHPHAADVHYLLGELLSRQDQPERAREHFRTATLAAELELNNPRVTASWYELGRNLADAGYLTAADEALARFDDASFDSHPEHRDAAEVREILADNPQGGLMLRVEVLKRLGAPESAAAALERALHRAPDDLVVAQLLARTLLDAGQARRAWEFCMQRLASPGPAVELVATAVEAAQAAGTLDEWIAGELAALDARGDVAAATALARQLAATGALPQAVQVWSGILARRPGDADTAWALANVQLAAGQRAESLETLIAAFRNDASGESLPRAAFDEWVRRGLPPDSAVELIDGFRSRPDHDGFVELALGLAATAAGLHDLAGQCFTAGLTARPDSALAHLIRGRSAAARFDWTTARAEAEAAMKLNADSIAARVLLGDACAGLDELDQAETAYKKAIELRPGDPTAALALARLHFRNGNLLAAQRYYQEALTAQPGNGEAIEGLIDSYLGGGKSEIAQAQLHQARSAGLSPDVKRRIETALRFAASPYQTAHLEELARQAAQHPSDAETALRLAAGLYVHQRYDEALKRVSSVLACDPYDERASILLANIQARRLEFGPAVDALQELARRYPNRRSVLESLAECCLSDFRLDEARRAMIRLASLAPNDEARALYRARLLSSYTEFSESGPALELLQEWLRDAPNDAGLRRQRLELLVAAGRSAEAVDEVTRALDAAPDDSERRGEFLVVCERAREFRSAESRLREWLKASPNEAELTRALLFILIADHRAGEAVELLKSFEPQSWDAAIESRIWRSRALAAAERFADAVEELDSLLDEQLAASRAGVRSSLRRQLLLTLIDARDYDGAIKRIDQWLADAAPGDALERFDLLSQKRIVLQAAGRDDDATKILEALITQTPNDAGLNNDLGYSWVDQGKNLERATGMIKLAVAQSPWNHAYLDSLGWAYYKRGDFAAAREYLHRAVRLREGQDPVLYDHRGDAEYRLGDRSAAIASWKKAAELIETRRREAGSRPDEREATLLVALRAKLAAAEAGSSAPVAPTAAEQNPEASP
jgi:tetratricopeptide (TPR) repeat protein